MEINVIAIKLSLQISLLFIFFFVALSSHNPFSSHVSFLFSENQLDYEYVIDHFYYFT
jgi:hypothetical protein